MADSSLKLRKMAIRHQDWRFLSGEPRPPSRHQAPGVTGHPDLSPPESSAKSPRMQDHEPDRCEYERESRQVQAGHLHSRFTGDLKDDARTYLYGVVGEPLVIAAKERDVDGRCDSVFPLRVHEHGEEMAVEVVHVVIVVGEFGRSVRDS